MNEITKKDISRFWDKVVNKGKDECWEWTAAKNRDRGYGMFSINGKMYYAHRIVWMWTNQLQIPDGMCILHHCDNPSCVNPNHLFLGTHADNTQDSYNKGRSTQQGVNNSRSKLTREQVVIIKKSAAKANLERGNKTAFYKRWSDKFGISQGAVRAILDNRSWTHINLIADNVLPRKEK